MRFARDVDVRFGDIGSTKFTLRRLLALSRAWRRWRKCRLCRAANDNGAKSQRAASGHPRPRPHPSISHFLFLQEAAHGALGFHPMTGGALRLYAITSKTRAAIQSRSDAAPRRTVSVSALIIQAIAAMIPLATNGETRNAASHKAVVARRTCRPANASESAESGANHVSIR